MPRKLLVLSLTAVMALCLFSCRSATTQGTHSVITLPSPKSESKVTVEQALQQRRSVRAYSQEPLTLQQVSELLWAAQGITEPTRGLRTAPSAGATYPLRVYLIAGNVTGLAAGVYRYIPQGHKLEFVLAGDQRETIGNQPQMRTPPALVLYAADYAGISARYHAKARDYTMMEAGHSAQNVLLEEVALGLVGVPMGAFDPDKTRAALNLPRNEEPIYILSAAKKQQ